MRKLIIAAMLFPQPALAQQARIGAAAAVQGSVKAAGKVVSSGAPIYQNDRVTTDAKGRLQILLLDETVFTIGPNSDMTLDEFVYDPNTSAGKVSARVTKGVFRFVTGKVAKREPGNMKVNTPVGTIGIRGTIAGGEVNDQGTTVVLLGPGANNNTGDNPGGINVSNNNGDVDINQPNFGTTMTGDSGPSDPEPMPEFAAKISDSLDADDGGKTASTGGTPPAEGEESASEEAGQETAAGGTTAVETEETQAITEELAEDTTVATQEETQEEGFNQETSIVQLESLVGTRGVWLYSGSGDYTCSGGISNCASGGSGTVNANIYVDFDSREIGPGGFTQINLSGDINATTGVSPISFDDVLSGGGAKFDLTPGVQSEFSGTSFGFQNNVETGGLATDAILDLKYSHSNNGDLDPGTVIEMAGEEAPPS